MRTLVWDSSFRRAFRRVIRKNPQLEERIFAVLELLVADPFDPALTKSRDSPPLWVGMDSEPE